jgi:hypothetical protein
VSTGENSLEEAATSGTAVHSPAGHVDDFDFLVGDWKVRHRRLVGRLVGSTTWEEFDGECRMQKVLGGRVNVDDNVLEAASGAYRAAAIRTFDPTSNAWSIFWIDSRYPPATIADPVVGGFENGRGVFFCDDEWEGRAIRTRFTWDVDGLDSCCWEQAFSPDNGVSWETNWYMTFRRTSWMGEVAASNLATAAQATLCELTDEGGDGPAGQLDDFDFLVGNWTVHHRCLIGSTWQEFEGECSMQKLLGGQANIDENIWEGPSGVNRAIAVRVFDPARSAWSISWLDMRWPSTFGPPVIGGFQGDHGVFFGDDELDGRAIQVRFDWFVDAADSCRWQQSFSLDNGNRWETNWHMHFTREMNKDKSVPQLPRRIIE